MDQARNCCDDAGCQGLPVIGRVTFNIPNLWDQRIVGMTLDSGWLSVTLAAGNLGISVGSGVLVGLVSRELSNISCNSLISRSCLSPV